jgi:putative transposase
MAHYEFDLSELLDALRAGGDIDIIRRSVEMVLQALIDAEATEVIGAGRHERTDTRTNQRNGTRPRLLSERRRRIDRALFAVVMEAYVLGVSTRKVDDLVKSLGLEAGISKSEVSRICSELDGDLEAFSTRTLGHVEVPYVFVDATFVKGCVRGRVVSRAVVVATGVTATGDREVLGVDIGATDPTPTGRTSPCGASTKAGDVEPAIPTHSEQILHPSNRHGFWPVDHQRCALADQHCRTQRQHVLDPVGPRRP